MSLLEIALAIGLMHDAQIETVPPEDVVCLAENIYHEARGESTKGQQAVAHVTLNRVEDDRWPDNICDVVFQNKQFSWTVHAPLKIREPAAFERAVSVALNAIIGVSDDPTDGATFYFDHSRVTPRWSQSFDRVAVIGDHTFMR